jgi:hypothetical protein
VIPEVASPDTPPASVAQSERPAPAGTVRAWFARRRRGRGAALAAAGLAAVVIAVGSVAGLWFLPFAAGMAAGLAPRRWRLRAVPLLAAGVAAAGWAIPLAWRAASGEPVGATARTVAALAGLPPSASLIVGVTLLVAALQAMAGTWLARALRGWRVP